MAPWRAIARSFPPGPRIRGIATDAPPRPRSHDIRSKAGPGSPAPPHHAPGAGGDRIRCTQNPCEQASAAPTVSVSSPLRPVRADTPGTPATPESPSIPCASTAECTQKRHLTESSIFECFHEFLRRATLSNRLGRAGWSVEMAMTEPPRKPGRSLKGRFTRVHAAA